MTDLHERLRRVSISHALSVPLQGPRNDALRRPGVTATTVLCEVLDVLSNNGTTLNHAATPVHNVRLFHLMVPSKQVNNRHRERITCINRGNHLMSKNDENGEKPTSNELHPFLYHSVPPQEWLVSLSAALVFRLVIERRSIVTACWIELFLSLRRERRLGWNKEEQHRERGISSDIACAFADEDENEK